MCIFDCIIMITSYLIFTFVLYGVALVAQWFRVTPYKWVFRKN